MDYRSAKIYKSETEALEAREGSGYPSRWWLEEDCDKRCQGVIDMAKSLEQNSGERHQANLRHARLYENIELDSLGSSDFAVSVVMQAIRGRGLVRQNVVAACQDTLGAKIAKNKPRPSFLTSGGSWDKQQKARRLDKFARGMFYEMDIYEKSKEVFNDACTFGDGFLHFYQDEATGRLDCERVLPDELFVDDLDAFYGKPRTLLRRKYVQREVLCAMFPDKAGDLYAADNTTGAGVNRKNLTPIVEVWEAWHLPSSKKAKDGMHCISVDGVELLCEPWKLDCFPFVKFQYKKRTVGFWGKGVAETLTGIQLELNRTIMSVSEQLRRKGRGRIFLQHGSKVNPAQMTNGIADIVFYTGTPPVVDSSSAVSQDEMMHIERLYRMAFQEVGISELSVSAKKPSGLDAAVALREYSDIESERFSLVHQAWETFFMDCIKLCLKLIRYQVGNKGYLVKLPSKRYVIEMDWSEIAMEEDDYIIQIFPVSSLPQTPAARYQKVKEMMADGFIDKATAQRLLDYPDLESEQNLANAALDDADATISAILDEATPRVMPLEPFQNLELIVQRANAAYLFARHHDCPEDRLDMVRQLIEQATAKMQEIAMATAPMPMAGPPGSPASGPVPPGPAGMPGQGPATPLAPRIGGDLTINAAPPVAPAVPPTVAG